MKLLEIILNEGLEKIEDKLAESKTNTMEKKKGE